MERRMLALDFGMGFWFGKDFMGWQRECEWLQGVNAYMIIFTLNLSPNLF
jgi:hypothetical protein